MTAIVLANHHLIPWSHDYKMYCNFGTNEDTLYVHENIQSLICINSRWLPYDLPIINTYQMNDGNAQLSPSDWAYHYLGHGWTTIIYPMLKANVRTFCGRNMITYPIRYTGDIDPVEAELWDSNVKIWHYNFRMCHCNVNNSIIISRYDIIMTLCIWPFNVFKSESGGWC